MLSKPVLSVSLSFFGLDQNNQENRTEHKNWQKGAHCSSSLTHRDSHTHQLVSHVYFNNAGQYNREFKVAEVNAVSSNSPGCSYTRTHVTLQPVLTPVSGEGLFVYALGRRRQQHERHKRQASFLLHFLPSPQEYTLNLDGVGSILSQPHSLCFLYSLYEILNQLDNA